ncbi:MAG: hypothetical protein J5722_06360, partial [Oscillospiraceae bacterium]|nr:hypothetical protein [Oscillospiraceae bacterium]
MKTKIMIALLAAVTLCGCTAAPQGGTAQTAEDNSTAETSAAPEDSAEESQEPADASSEESSEEEVKEPPSRNVGDIDPNAITFDSGEMYTGHQMGEGGDEADIELSVVDFEGDKKLKVHVLRDDPSSDFGVPKIVFNLPQMIGKDRVGDIGHISVDFTCVGNELWKNDDGSESLVVGNFLGALAGNLASEKGKDDDGNVTQNTWATHFEFKHEDWEFPEHSWRIETDVPGNKIPANGYAANDDGTTLVIMRWP